MKRIFLALFILIATSSLAQVNVVGYIQTNGVANYPTHIDSMGKGGYVVVRDTTQRNAITCLRRKYGMAAYVQSEQKLYILKDSNCANTWVEFTAGGGTTSTAGAFGSFYDSTTQSITSTTTAYPIILSKTDTASGFHITSNRIIADSSGIYNLQWSGQFQNADNAEQNVTVWIRKNGVNVIGSSGKISIPKTRGANLGHTVAGWNYIVPMTAGDSVVFYWQADNVAVTIQYYPQGTSPTRPSTASILATITPANGGGGSGGGSQGLQSVIDVNDSLNTDGFHFRTPSSSPYAVYIITNAASTYAPNLVMPATSGTIALEGNQNKAVTYTPIDLKNNGDYGVLGNGYYNIHVGSDTADAFYPGFLQFPVATSYAGQRITIVNNDTGYKFPAYIAQSIYDVPLLEGTNNLVTCIPYGMTYEFVSMNGYWYATTLKQRETRANLVVGTIGIDTEPYDLNSTNAIYQFTRFRSKYDSTIIGTINFPPASYVYGSDTIPINDGQRITIINDQGNYPIAIGENKPYKTGFDGFDDGAGTNYGVIDTIPPSVTYEFVSVGGYWRLTTPIFIPEYFGSSVASADYKITTYGIYKFESNGNNVILPSNPKFHRGETIIIQNVSAGGIAVKYDGGASFTNISSGQTITIIGIGDDWVIISAYP